MSRISRIGSLSTGQMSTQAPQEVQAQTASAGMANSVSAGESLSRIYRVEEIAFVDLQRGRRKHLPGGIGRADLLAAEAHDAGVGVHQLLPAQVAEFRSPELLDGGVVQVDVTQLADRAPFRLEQVIERGEKQMDVLGVREIRDEDHDQADGQPEGDMLADDERLRAHPGPQTASCRSERLPVIGFAGRGDGERFAHEACPDMQEDEGRHDGRIPPDAKTRLRVEQSRSDVLTGWRAGRRSGGR